MNWEKLSVNQVIAFTFLAIALIIPGYGYLYLTEDSVMQYENIVKIIIISVFYSTPVFMVCMFVIIPRFPNEGKKPPFVLLSLKSGV